MKMIQINEQKIWLKLRWDQNQKEDEFKSDDETDDSGIDYTDGEYYEYRLKLLS